VPIKLENLDFRFENSPVKIIANRNFPETKLAGLTVGPFEEGNDYDVCYWIAEELAEVGVVHFSEEDRFGPTELYKVQWKERVQVAGQISELPDNFYPKLRRYIANMKKEIAKQPEKMQEYEKAKQLASDIVNSRLKKIVALSSGPAQTDPVLKKMASEERLIYERLGKTINRWRTQILQFEEER
jgi:hypothetical protein